MRKPYHIIEVANTHGGDFDYINELIYTFNDLKEGYGIKFQPFHADCIATNDYDWHETYKKLHFEKQGWEKIINHASETKDVWLDIFDIYGIDVLKDNYDVIYGIKFQSSVLYNYEVFTALQAIGLYGKKIILNIAAQSITNIKEIIDRVAETLTPSEILLEFGYQGYPTSLEDSGLCKLEIIKEQFNNRIVFADHVDGKSDDAIWLPVIACMNGIDCVEKHVMLETRETKYDYFSSLTPMRYREMSSHIERYLKIKEMPFINENEVSYLKKTLMIPIIVTPKHAGSGFDLSKDFIFRRSGKKGINIQEIECLQNTWHLLAYNKEKGVTCKKVDFKKATIAIIFA